MTQPQLGPPLWESWPKQEQGNFASQHPFLAGMAAGVVWDALDAELGISRRIPHPVKAFLSALLFAVGLGFVAVVVGAVVDVTAGTPGPDGQWSPVGITVSAAVYALAVAWSAFRLHTPPAKYDVRDARMHYGCLLFWLLALLLVVSTGSLHLALVGLFVLTGSVGLVWWGVRNQRFFSRGWYAKRGRTWGTPNPKSRF